jgi:hypothetical protein
VDGWRRREIGISGGGSLRRPRPIQGCSAEKKKKKNIFSTTETEDEGENTSI